ncbi:MAG: DUF2135 domain-containing protein [Kiritimatiellae bacterium]|nr:DUF2135 domain-containing protein [Kiritimatiellia bacterium]
MKTFYMTLATAATALAANAKTIIPRPVPRPLPPPVIRPVDLRADEKPVEVEASAGAVVEDNGLYRRIRTTFTFTNPNSRQMSADFEFPIPADATVCGYALEVNGTMVPGVVCGKEKARVAFESEKAKRVDPGIVEHVAGNVWKTRIFPLMPKKPRKAEVDYIVPLAEAAGVPLPQVVYERDGDDVFVGERAAEAAVPVSMKEKIATFTKGTIMWDASGSAASSSAAWRKKLESLPEKGEWSLVVFRNDCQTIPRVKELTKEKLLKEIDGLVYDGGTDIAAALRLVGSAEFPLPALLFTDEIDTLGLVAPQYDDRLDIIVASRDDVPTRPITVRRLAKGEKLPDGVTVKEGKLLATAWAANRVKDLSAQAENRAEEFLALGRRYGVASAVTSLIVLESLEQYLEHKIEPPKSMSFYDEWVRHRAAEDDQIAAKEKQAEHERDLLRLWKERVEWWKNPVPPRRTPKSGLFGTAAAGAASALAVGAAPRQRSMHMRNSMAMDMAVAESAAPASAMADEESARYSMVRNVSAGWSGSARAKSAPRRGSAGSGGATIKLAAWNPQTPYLKALDACADGDAAYVEYLRQKKEHGSAPAFYMDCAGLFFKKGWRLRGWRILSNMAEFKLEDAAVWRAMGWRLREAGQYNEAEICFRKALKLRNEEGQSRRDLALVLFESGKAAKNAAALTEAMALLKEAAFTNFARRSGRRSNDRQVSIVALEELNALIAWCNAVTWPDAARPTVPEMDAAYRRDLPTKIRIVLSWDADETDIDLHVLEPDGEEAYYGHRRTSSGGFVSEDVTTGYGPEEYLRKEGLGTFKVLSNYYASHQTALTGATTATATVYTDWGTAAEKVKIMTLRLDKPKDKHLIGEITVE